MDRTKYRFQDTSKVTGKIGQIIPFYFREVCPGDNLNIRFNHSARLAVFAQPISGIFRIMTKFFFVSYKALQSNWNNAYTAGGNMDTPYLQYTFPVNNAVDLYNYFGGSPECVGVDTYNVCAHLWRAYRQIYCYKYIKNMQAIQTDADFDIVRTDGLDATTPRVTSQDFYDPEEDLYSYLRDNQQMTGAVSIAATPFTIEELRVALSTQKFRERANSWALQNVDHIKNLFGIKDKGYNPERPNEIYSNKRYMVINEIVSTAATTEAPLGASTSFAYDVSPNQSCHLRAEDFGLVMGMVSIVPVSSFHQGLHTEALHRGTSFDFFTPDLVGLGLQPVTRREVGQTGTNATDQTVVGYRPIYDHLRTSKHIVGGSYKEDHDELILRRTPSSWTPAGLQQVDYTEYDYLFAVPAEPNFRFFSALDIEGERPVPKIYLPGYSLIDK